MYRDHILLNNIRLSPAVLCGSHMEKGFVVPRGMYVRTDAYRQKQREAMARRENPGLHKSDETRRKIGDAQRGKPKSEEFRLKCRERAKGRPSPMLGRKHTDEFVQMKRKAWSGEGHPKWKGGIVKALGKSQYSVSLRRKKNGFSIELYDQRLAAQDGKCAICCVELTTGLREQSASADHCHATNTPRGILCKRCNWMIGHAKDNPETLRKAAEYLEMWKRTA